MGKKNENIGQKINNELPQKNYSLAAYGAILKLLPYFLNNVKNSDSVISQVNNQKKIYNDTRTFQDWVKWTINNLAVNLLF
jgi:hypothetical protein